MGTDADPATILMSTVLQASPISSEARDPAQAAATVSIHPGPNGLSSTALDKMAPGGMEPAGGKPVAGESAGAVPAARGSADPAVRPETATSTKAADAKPAVESPTGTSDVEPLATRLFEILAGMSAHREPELDVTRPAHVSMLEDSLRASLDSRHSEMPTTFAPGTPAKSESLAVAIASDPLTRACQFVMSHFGGLHYLDFSKLVDVIQPVVAADGDSTERKDSSASTVPVPALLPTDLTGPLQAAKIGRTPSGDGRMVLGFQRPGEGVALRDAFQRDQFGYVYGRFELLVRSTLPVEASVAVRRGWVGLAVELGRDNDDLGAEILRGFVARATKDTAGKESGGRAWTQKISIRLLGEALDAFLGEPLLAGAARQILSEWVAANDPGFALAVTAVVTRLTAADRCDWLARIAQENGSEGRDLVEAELWWRFTGRWRQNAEMWDRFQGWFQRKAKEGDVFAAWSRRLARRILAWHAVDRTGQPAVFEVLARVLGRGAEPASEGASATAGLINGLAGGRLGAGWALATTLDAMRAKDVVPGCLALDWERLEASPARFPFLGGVALAPNRPGLQRHDARNESLVPGDFEACLRWDEPEVALLLTELAWRLGLHSDTSAARLRSHVVGALSAHSESRIATLRALSDLCRDLLRHDRAIEQVSGLSRSAEERVACRHARVALRGKWRAAGELRAALWKASTSELCISTHETP